MKKKKTQFKSSGMTDQNTGNSLHMAYGPISCFVHGIIREWMAALGIEKQTKTTNGNLSNKRSVTDGFNKCAKTTLEKHD